MKKNNILITGGTGFLGNNLVRYFTKKYPERIIVNYSRHTYATNPLTHKDLEKNPNYVPIAGDINDVLLFKETLEKYKIGTLYHLAASTHVDRSFIYPEEFLKANVQGNFAVLEVLRKINKKPLMIYMGTDEVFGDIPEGFCREDELRAPRNPYSASKASAEMYCIAYHHSFDIPIIIARSMNMFGPYQHPEKLIGKIITRCLTDTHFTLFEGGSKIMKKEELFDGYKGRRLKDDERYALDAAKFEYILKWKPPTGFEKGIRNTIKWFDKNRWYWHSLYEAK